MLNILTLHIHMPSHAPAPSTDAFYTIDGHDKRCSELTEDDLQQAHKDLSSGWGIVIFPAGRTPCHKRPYPTQTLTAIHQLASVHLLPRSYHSTSPLPTLTHDTIHPAVRQ